MTRWGSNIFDMATKRRWKDEYWLMLMYLYLKKPAGVKPLYSRHLVDLALELHLPPKYLYRKMFQLRRLSTPRLERLWNDYYDKPQKIAKGVMMLRQMNGFNNAEAFYDGVEMNESFEIDFKPLATVPDIKPVTLVLILDLYFRLTPNTMVKETPEIKELAQLTKVSTEQIVQVMDIYQCCDPYLQREQLPTDELVQACQRIWQQWGNDKPENLYAYATQLKAYFK